MINVTNKDIGKEVKYLSKSDEQTGVITSFNDKFIFVKYHNSGSVQATTREDLEYNIRGDYCFSCEYARIKKDMMILIKDEVKYYFCTDKCLISFITKKPLTLEEMGSIEVTDELQLAEIEAENPNR